MSEHTEQVALFNWCKIKECRHPQLALIFSIPNGGLRHKAVAIKLQREGVRAGVPDIFLACPSPLKDKHGLFIELKYGKNKPTQNQLQWMHKLRMEGYATELCYGFEEAKNAIVNYLGLEEE